MDYIDDIIEDILKIYLSSIDSYNSKIYQTINDKYTIIDKSMLTMYLFIKIIEDRNEKNEDIGDALTNYLLKQNIYGETGNLAFEITDKSKTQLYHEILNKLILEKFQYKNRIMKKLKYNYKNIELNKYINLLMFLENIAEFVIFQKILLRGNQEALPIFNSTKSKIMEQQKSLDNNDYFYKEKNQIINLIIDNKFNESQYGNLMMVVLNLREVYRYSSITTGFPENVLFHQYTVAIISLLIAEYSNKGLGENIDIYTILTKSLFHDFSEYKGTEIVTHFKNYNEITKKMFKEIEQNDEKELEEKIGTNLYNIIFNCKNGVEGFIYELIDKMLGIAKLWIEVEYYHNYTFIKAINSIYQERFKRFLKIENINGINNKPFYIELLRKYYIYIKENLIEKDLECFFKYYTEEELTNYRKELKLLKTNPETFLN